MSFSFPRNHPRAAPPPTFVHQRKEKEEEKGPREGGGVRILSTQESWSSHSFSATFLPTFLDLKASRILKVDSLCFSHAPPTLWEGRYSKTFESSPLFALPRICPDHRFFLDISLAWGIRLFTSLILPTCPRLPLSVPLFCRRPFRWVFLSTRCPYDLGRPPPLSPSRCLQCRRRAYHLSCRWTHVISSQ